MPDVPLEAQLAGVAPGQVWADNDPRAAGRTVRVDEVDSRYAYCTVLTNPTKTQEHLDAYARGHFPNGPILRDARGKTRRILLTRMRPTSTGYRLIPGEDDRG